MRRSPTLTAWLIGLGGLLASSLWAQQIIWQPDLSTALATARQQNRIVMIDVYTDWCTWCQVLDEKTYSDRRVVQALRKDFVSLKVNPEKSKEFAARYPVNSYPTILFLEGSGMVVHQLAGFVEPPRFLKLLEEAKAKGNELSQARQAFDRNPEDVEANTLLAEFYLRNRKIDEAADHINRLCRVDRQDPKGRQGSLLLQLGAAYGVAEEHEKALETFKRVINHSACRGELQEAWALYFIGVTYLQQDKSEPARDHFEQARKHPKAPQDLKERAARILKQLAEAR